VSLAFSDSVSVQGRTHLPTISSGLYGNEEPLEQILLFLHSVLFCEYVCLGFVLLRYLIFHQTLRFDDVFIHSIKQCDHFLFFLSGCAFFLWTLNEFESNSCRNSLVMAVQ